MMNVQDRAPYPGAAATQGTGYDAIGVFPQAAPNFRLVPLGGDSFKRSPAPRPGLQAPAPGAFSQLIAQLMAILQQLLSAFGLQSGGQRFYRDAQAASLGDPHLSFSGTGSTGRENAQFDSMSGHDDLIDSDSFEGGYRVSTQTTAPDARGTTYNQSATVSTNFGQTQVTLDKNGTASLDQDGRTTVLVAGKCYDAGNGETIERAADGSLTVTQCNAQGGRIVTTMRQNGNGVDVTTSAQDVDLGGDLVDTASPQPPESWRRRPESLAGRQPLEWMTGPD